MSKLPEDKRAVFTDVYKFYEQFWDMPDNEESWAACAREMAAVVGKHDGPLVIQLAMACYNAIDEEYKEIRRAIENV